MNGFDSVCFAKNMAVPVIIATLAAVASAAPMLYYPSQESYPVNDNYQGKLLQLLFSLLYTDKSNAEGLNLPE